MSWKAGNSSLRSLLSLTTRLTASYTLSTMGIFFIMSLFLYPTLMLVISHVSGDNAASILHLCYKNFFIALIVCLLSSIILGKWVTRLGLKSIQELSEKMGKISVESLHERISIEELPIELKSLGHQFNSMLQRIQASFTQLSQFSSDIAHELRNPLNNLQGVTELALTQPKLPTEIRKVLLSNMAEYQHLAKLVDHLLFLARVDQRQLQLNKKTVQARDEVIKIIEYFQPLADENQISICCEGDALLSIDVTLFKRVLHNLLANALKYTPAKGGIQISCLALDKTTTQLSIQDSGIGIAEKDLKQIFDRFYRVDPSRSSLSGGLGLGLAIVKAIVELHGGSVAIESQVGHGTTVHLTMKNHHPGLDEIPA